MKTIDIKVNYNCNNHCKFCVQGEKRKFFDDKTTDEIQLFLRESKPIYRTVIFTGGEPTIRKDIIDLVGYAKDLGYDVQIQSNGRMFYYKDFCREIINAGANGFGISLHGHTARLHDYLTEAKGSFLQTTKGIENILSLGKMVATNTVINKFNYRFLPEIAKYLVNLGIPNYQFAFPHILGSAKVNFRSIVPMKKTIISYVKRGLNVGLKKGRVARVEAVPYCLLKDYEHCITEQFIPETKVFDVEVIKNFKKWKKDVGKKKCSTCQVCKYYECCEGPWREYTELFGWKEFRPVNRIK